MSRIKSLILLLSSLLGLTACGYSFVLDGGGTLAGVDLSPSVNLTALREAGIVMDASLERALPAMGLKSSGPGFPQLKCHIVKAGTMEITSENLNSSDRYRLTLQVRAELYADGAVVWQGMFSDEGVYSESGQEEDGLADACDGLAEQIARRLTALKLEEHQS